MHKPKMQKYLNINSYVSLYLTKCCPRINDKNKNLFIS